MEFRTFIADRMQEVIELFWEEGWTDYLEDEEKLGRAFENSLFCLGAFDEADRLAGFARCVGDGEHIVLVQDLIVRRECRHMGVGTILLRRVMERFSNVRMLQLNTDIGDEAANGFYRSLGMRELKDGGMVSYFR